MLSYWPDRSDLPPATTVQNGEESSCTTARRTSCIAHWHIVEQTCTSRHAAFQTWKADGRQRLASGGSIHRLWVGRCVTNHSAGSRLDYQCDLRGRRARDAFRLAFPRPVRKARVRQGRGGSSATLGVLFLRVDGLGLGAWEGFTDPVSFRGRRELFLIDFRDPAEITA